MGYGPQKIGPHFFHLGLGQLLFPLGNYIRLDSKMGGHGAGKEGDRQHADKGDGVARQGKIQLKVGVCEHVIDADYSHHRADNAVKIPHTVARYQHESQNKDKHNICAVVGNQVKIQCGHSGCSSHAEQGKNDAEKMLLP